MRAHIAAGFLALMAVAIGMDALAQGSGKGKAPPPRPPPPPIPRCADLAIGDYAIGAIETGAQPLGANEFSVRWEVRNAGGAPYASSDSSQQWVALEYVTPGGPQELGQNALPPGVATQAPDGFNMAPTVNLGPGESWRGYLRATIPPEAGNRPLRLRIGYAARRGPPNDCDMDNNTAPLRR